MKIIKKLYQSKTRGNKLYYNDENWIVRYLISDGKCVYCGEEGIMIHQETWEGSIGSGCSFCYHEKCLNESKEKLK